jgi:hypothetical protein
MAKVFKLQYETVPLQGVLRFRSGRAGIEDGRAATKWWISRTGAERTFEYMSTGSAESRHLQAGMT